MATIEIKQDVNTGQHLYILRTNPHSPVDAREWCLNGTILGFSAREAFASVDAINTNREEIGLPLLGIGGSDYEYRSNTKVSADNFPRNHSEQV